MNAKFIVKIRKKYTMQTHNTNLKKSVFIILINLML